MSFIWALGGEVINYEEHTAILGSPAWADETVITAGAHSLHAYKAVHNTASESHLWKPGLGDVGGSPSDFLGNQDHMVMQAKHYLDDTTPADPIVIMIGTGAATDNGKVVTYCELQTNGNLKLKGNILNDIGIVTTPMRDTKFVTLMAAYDRISSTEYKYRLWANYGGLWVPLFEHTDPTLTAFTGFQFITIYSLNHKGVTAPLSTHIVDDIAFAQYTAESDISYLLSRTPVKVALMTLNANGFYGSFTSSQDGEGIGGPDFNDVNETAVDDEGSWNGNPNGTGANRRQTYQMTVPTFPIVPNIETISFITRGRAVAGAASKYKTVVYDGTNTADAQEYTGGTYAQLIWNKNLDLSGNPWTPDALINLEIGGNQAAATNFQRVRLTKAYALVGYTEPLILPGRRPTPIGLSPALV